MQEFAPIDVSALDCNAVLKDQMKSQIGDRAMFLEPRHQFIEGDGIRFDKSVLPPRLIYYESSTYLQSPPPVIGDIAIKELRYACLKRQKFIHIVVRPYLFVCLWKQQLHEVADMLLTFPLGLSSQPVNVNEPLFLAFYSPFRRFNPWQMWRTLKIACGKEVIAEDVEYKGSRQIESVAQTSIRV